MKVEISDEQAELAACEPATNFTDPATPELREQFFTSLYLELCRLAGRELRCAGPAAPMGATTLVHEAYLNFASRPQIAFANRAHFLTYASRAMRGLIIDRARAAAAEKRGGGTSAVRLDTALGETLAAPEQIAGIGPLLDVLAEVDAELAQVVDLKFFCGFTFAEIANLRGCSERTAQRNWEQARLLLQRLSLNSCDSRDAT